jgi:hypothetical protein
VEGRFNDLESRVLGERVATGPSFDS